jgi:PhoD-like phosphatase
MPHASPRVRVNLLELGVGLGNVTPDYVFVLINNRVHHAEIDAIAVVPVIGLPRAAAVDEEPPAYGQFRRARYRLYREREDGPDAERSPDAADIGATIDIVSPQSKAERVRANPAKGSDRARPVAAGVSSRPELRALRRYKNFAVARTFWHGADGVLFLQVQGDAFDPALADDIAAGIADRLFEPGVERCVVPTAAVAVPARSDELCFALGSCQYTAGIIDSTPRIDEVLPRPGPADASYARLAARLRSPARADRPELLIIAGDHVYVDATAGLFDPALDAGKYLKPYDQLYSSIYVQDIARQIPVCAMLDDHEIADNWENEGDAEAAEALRLGVASYLRYQRAYSLLDNPRSPVEEGQLWSEVERKGFHFFFADTRTGRQKRTAADFWHQRIMHPKQMEALQAWLLRRQCDDERARPCFVVSASILLPRRRTSLAPSGALRSDAWDGYPRSQAELMAFIADKQIKNAFFLSGDEHLCVVAEASLQGAQGVAIRSIHSSGMYAPFPFANSIPEDLLAVDDSLVTGRHAWTARAEFAPRGQGFAVINVTRDSAGCYTVAVQFDLDSVPQAQAQRYCFRV